MFLFFKISNILFLLIFFTIVLFNTSYSQQSNVKAPQFRIRNLNEDRFDSRNLKNDVIVVSFFYTKCPPCIKEMPELFNFMKEKGRLNNLLFVDPWVKAMDINGTPDDSTKLKRFANRLKISHKNIYLDVVGTLTKKFIQIGIFKKAKKYGTFLVFPTIVVIDKKGNFAYILEGSNPQFLNEIRKYL